ncbi:hypothetical protein F4810DRAFT_121831 [Camillea tinctor]|nr:hypothetical protein F4810DRAFT_121831 [Camillea tinctor]
MSIHCSASLFSLFLSIPVSRSSVLHTHSLSLGSTRTWFLTCYYLLFIYLPNLFFIYYYYYHPRIFVDQIIFFTRVLKLTRLLPKREIIHYTLTTYHRYRSTI